MGIEDRDGSARVWVVPAIAAVVLHGDRVGIDDRFPLVAVTALRPHAVAGSAVVAAGLAGRRPGVAVALAGLAAAAVPALVRRRARAATVRAGDPDGEWVVLAANVWKGRADPHALLAHLDRERPDLVALSEAGHRYQQLLRPMLDARGYRSWTSTGPGVPDGAGVVLLAGPRTGAVTVSGGPEMRHRHLVATGGRLGDRAFVVAHPAAPTSLTRTREWRSDLDQLARWSHAGVAPIIAGDLNATVDHARLRAVLGPVTSAAHGSGHGLAATFPTALRPGLPTRIAGRAGIHIDHVLVPSGTSVRRYAVLDVAGSDHRGVVAAVTLGAEARS